MEVAEHSVANGVLELVPGGGREMGGLVELERALGILAEHAVDDTDVKVEGGQLTMRAPMTKMHSSNSPTLHAS